jgi:hypothetical protein
VTGLRLPMRTEPWPRGSNAARPCPVCGKRWVPWAGSRLPCHAACLYDEPTKSLIRREVLASTDSVRTIARRMGLSYKTLQGLIASRRKVS